MSEVTRSYFPATFASPLRRSSAFITGTSLTFSGSDSDKVDIADNTASDLTIVGKATTAPASESARRTFWRNAPEQICGVQAGQHSVHGPAVVRLVLNLWNES